MDSMLPEKNVQKVLRLKEEINQEIQELELLAKVFRKNLKTCPEQRRRISPFGRNDMGVAIFCQKSIDFYFSVCSVKDCFHKCEQARTLHYYLLMTKNSHTQMTCKIQSK